MIPSQAVRWLRPALLLTLGLPVAAAARHVSPAIESATRFAAVDTHADEGVSIGAEPYETKEKCAFFRVNYLGRGIMPVQVAITNQSDQILHLHAMRILLLPASGAPLATAGPEEIEQRFSMKRNSPAQKSLSLVRRKSSSRDKLIEQDYDDFEFNAETIAPHTTRSGFLFFVVENPADSLRGAHLEAQGIFGANHQALHSFSIDFDRYLRSKSNQMN